MVGVKQMELITLLPHKLLLAKYFLRDMWLHFQCLEMFPKGCSVSHSRSLINWIFFFFFFSSTIITSIDLPLCFLLPPYFIISSQNTFMNMKQRGDANCIYLYKLYKETAATSDDMASVIRHHQVQVFDVTCLLDRVYPFVNSWLVEGDLSLILVWKEEDHCHSSHIFYEMLFLKKGKRYSNAFCCYALSGTDWLCSQ